MTKRGKIRGTGRRRTLVSRNSALALRGARPFRPGLLRAALFFIVCGFTLNYLWQWAPAARRWTLAAVSAPWLKTMKVQPVAQKKVPAQPVERKPLAFISGNRVMGVDREGVIFPLPKGQFFDLPFLSQSSGPVNAGDTLQGGAFALQVLAALAANPSPQLEGISDVRISAQGGLEISFADPGRRVRMTGMDAAGAVEDLRRVLAQPGLFVRGTLFVGYRNVAFLSQEEG